MPAGLVRAPTEAAFGAVVRIQTGIFFHLIKFNLKLKFEGSGPSTPHLRRSLPGKWTENQRSVEEAPGWHSASSGRAAREASDPHGLHWSGAAKTDSKRTSA